ncbi:MAG: helix-turn-helix domain-containing protein [Streptococcus thermophilus]
MNRLKELRKQKKLTIVELAEKILTILNWEHGTREIKGSNANKLAEYLLGYDTLTDLITKINEWAISHGLDKGNPKIEWMKVTEEVGEIRDVFLKPNDFDDPELALKDAIGDSIVTLVVLCLQLGYDVEECLKIAYNNIKDRKGKMVNGTFVKEEDL